MNLNKFTEKAQEAILATPPLASGLGHAQIEPEHLLVALVEQRDGVVPAVLQKIGIQPQAVVAPVREHLARQPKAYGGAEPAIRLRVAGGAHPHLRHHPERPFAADHDARQVGARGVLSRPPQRRHLPGPERSVGLDDLLGDESVGHREGG